MELQGLPAYNESDCPACPEFKEGLCAQCGKQIPVYASEGATQPTMVPGFQYPHAHHWHIRSVEGVAGQQAVRPTVCRECYLELYNKRFPDRKLTLDELPKVISYS